MTDLSDSRIQSIFDAALQDYESQTGIKLIDHPLARLLENCHSVESIFAIIQEQTRAFSGFRRDGSKMMKSLKYSVYVLHALSTSTTLDKSFPPAKAISAAFAILLAAIKDVSASYDALVDLLESIEHFLNRLDIYTKFPPLAAMEEIIVKIMVELLSTIALVTKKINQKLPLKLIKKFLGENEVEAVLRRLDRLTQDESRTIAAQTFEIVYGLIQNLRVVMDDGKASANGIRNALEVIQDIASKMNKLQRDQLQRDARKWLSPPDPWKNHNTAQESHHNGTSTWFLQGKAFAEWKSSGPNSLLWIHGKPGAGKSILCSTIIEDIDDMRKYGLASLAFFYCDFRDDDKKHLRGLVSSLVVQLCDHSDPYSTILSDFYSAHRNGSRNPSDDALIRCLKDILKHPGQAPVHIIIDALDECPDGFGMPSPREKVLMLVTKLVNLHLPNLRICITSRPEANVRAALDRLPFHHISLHDESGQMQDIVEYIKSVVNTDWKMERWRAADKELVIRVLTKKADGMFRWVSCQVDYLRRCLPARIRQALEELPESLDETYERVLQEIDEANWNFSHRLFQCVAVASRPLRVEELAEFLAFDFNIGPIPTFRADWRPEDPLWAVLSTCSSLLAVVEVDGSTVIQFSHFSVKEFLTSIRLAEAKYITSRRYHISMSPAHATVAQACLGILLHLDEKVTSDSLKNFPLAEYAAKYWMDHARFEDVLPITQDGLKCLFDPRRPHLAIWVWIFDPGIPWWHRSERPSQPRGSCLHYAALCGLPQLVTFLVMECPLDMNARGFFDEVTPLHLASRDGYVEVARVLIQNGADVNARDISKWTPLRQALDDKGHVEVALVLLEHGADVSAQGVDDWIPLHWASRRGHENLARVLLEHGADVNAQDVSKWTPFRRALDNEHMNVALLLVEYGADASAEDVEKCLPLGRASRVGNVEVVRELLEHGARVNARDELKLTALHWASHGGYTEVLRALLEYGADPNVKGDGNWTPLHWASERGHMEVTRTLLENGADASAQDKEKWTPLHWASERGHVEITRVLLENGADVSALNKDNRRPLHWASGRGHVGVVRMLLGNGADASAQDKDNWTPLHWASEHGHVEITRILLENGADASAQDKDNWMPLHWASERGHGKVTRALLEHGVDASAHGKDNETPLHRASRNGHFKVTQVLLENGAEASARDKNDWTPLHWASEGGHVETTRVLLENGADVSALNKDNRRPLHWASARGYVGVVRMLLENGADVSALDKDNRTPVHWASACGHYGVVQMLLENGADAGDLAW